VESGRQQAGEARATLARRYGIPVNTRLTATFLEKIIRFHLLGALPPAPAAAEAFLAFLAELPGSHCASPAPESHADEAIPWILKALSSGPEAVLAAVRPVFQAHEERLASKRAPLEAFRSKVEALPIAPVGLKEDLPRWARWLATPSPTPPPRAEPADTDLERLLAERSALAEEGRRAKPHQAHLEGALQFIREHWRGPHPQDCPTCGSHLEAAAEAVVAALLAATERDLAARREAYAALTARIRERETLRPAPAAGDCPVPLERRRQLETLVSTLLGPGPALAELLLDADSLRRMETLLGYAETPPSMPVPTPAGPAAEACAQAILSSCREAENLLAEPEAWDQVAKELTRRLSAVVAGHLPATLEALWRELAANLSSAPWLLSAPPSFRPRTHRGANRVDIVLTGPDGEDRLARHLLNDAQREVLGLAWTFCQYLVRTRFQHAWQLLDDPAQDLDQPTFRALCRFLATLMNLHERAGLPYTLILLLNQQDRAMDAARDLGQDLLLLGWTGRQEDATLQRIELFGPEVRSPQPAEVFVGTAS